LENRSKIFERRYLGWAEKVGWGVFSLWVGGACAVGENKCTFAERNNSCIFAFKGEILN